MALPLAAVLLTCGGLYAQATPPAVTAPAPAFSVTLTPAYVSQYIFRGQRLSGQSLEPSVELNYGNLGVGVWANVPIAGRVAGVSDPEIDPYAYYTVALSKTVSVVPGFTLYTYPRANTANGFFRSTFEPNLAVTGTFYGVRLTPKAYYDVVLDGLTLELSAAYAVPLRELGTELDFTAQAGDYLLRDAVNHSAPSVKASGRYWSAGVAVPWQLSSASRLSLGWTYSRGENAFAKQGSKPKAPNPLAASRGVVTLSYSCTF